MRLPLDLGPVLDGMRSISNTMTTIRDSVALLPEVAATLEEIRDGMQFLGDEVHRMRKGVDALGVEVEGVREAVSPLVPHMDLVAARIEALEPKLEDLSLAIHPLRRATGKLGRRRAALETDQQTGDEDQISSTENVSQSAGSPEE